MRDEGSDRERIVRQYFDCVDAWDTEGLLELFTDDATYERQGTPTIHGVAALRRFYVDERTIDSGRHRLDDVCAGADWVAVRGVFRGTLKTGADVEIAFTDWYHFRGGQIDLRQTLFPGQAV